MAMVRLNRCPIHDAVMIRNANDDSAFCWTCYQEEKKKSEKQDWKNTRFPEGAEL